MRNKILKIITMTMILCVGVIFSSTNTHAATVPITPGSVYENPTSGKKELCPNASDFDVSFVNGVARVTHLNVSCTEEYDAIMLPGTFIKSDEPGVSYTATYDVAVLRTISDLGKGMIVQDGAKLGSLVDDLNIDYVRFDEGSTLVDYAHAFKGWTKLTKVEGFLDAIQAGTSGSIDLGSTFYGCTSLKEIELDFKGRSATFYNTFTNCDKLTDVIIKNAYISKIEEMAVRGENSYSGVTGVNIYPMDIVFQNVNFPENGDDTGNYLNGAFVTISGTMTFDNCNASQNGLINFTRAFAKSKAIKINNDLIANYVNECPKESGAYSGGNIKIIGAKAYKADYMFNESAYGVITLNDFICENTRSAISMFTLANVVNIEGLDTWKPGETDLTQLFYDTTVLYDNKSTTENPNNIVENIKPDLEKADFSKVTVANKMMCFKNEGYIADYSGMNLGSVTMLMPVNNKEPFYTSEVAPKSYRLSYDNAYYQTEKDKTECGGYKLTRALGMNSGTIAGNGLQPNTLISSSCAQIRIINSVSGDVDVISVIGGHRLQEYLESDIDYFADTACVSPAVLSNVVNNGNNITVYTKEDCIKSDLDEGIGYDFGSSTGSINATIVGETEAIRLIDFEPTLIVKNEPTPEGYTLIPDAKKKASCKFYDASITVVHNGETKQVKSITRNLSITLPLPDDYDGNGVMVLHYDKGLDKAPTNVSTKVDTNAKTVQFYLKSFSHIALLYNNTETEQKEIKVKWVDDGNYRDRRGIVFNWTANYGGEITDTGTVTYTAGADSEKTLTFNVRKVILDSPLQSIDIEYELMDNVKHTPVWDAETSTLTLTYVDATVKENKHFKVDFSGVDTNDFNRYVSRSKSVTLTANVTFEDDTTYTKSVTRVVAANFPTYDLTVEVVTTNAAGKPAKEITYSINVPDGYEFVVDEEAETILVTKEPLVFEDELIYTVKAYFEDNHNANGTRPDNVRIKYTATYGEDKSSDYVSLSCDHDDGSIICYFGNISVFGTCNGIPRDGLTFEPDPVDGYDVEITKQDASEVRITYTPKASVTPTKTYKKKITFTFLNMSAPSSKAIIVHLQDSKGGNKIDRSIQLDWSSEVQSHDIEVPTDDNYIITSIDGLDGYKVILNELNVVVTPNTDKPNPNQTPTPEPVKKYTQNFSLEIKDNDNEDGSRPEKVTITVSDGKGTEEKIDFNTKDGKKYTTSIQSATSDPWSITKVEGFPERYKVDISGNNATANYTPEKVKKTVTAKFEGDEDNRDSTRPTSVTIKVMNGSNQVATANIDANTNWTVNVEVNKYVKGVEAKYTVDCDDVKNYSKSVSEDTITFKFTGTLKSPTPSTSPKPGNTLVGSNDGKSSSDDKEKEPDFSIDSFDWIDYANRYRDLKRAYGYNKQKLYAHYMHYGIAEGRYATFTGKYSTVNEDILAAYFPEDYKYALLPTDGNGSTKSNPTGTPEPTVSGNSLPVADPADGDSDTTEGEGEDNEVDTDDDNTVVNDDGTTTDKIKGEDGTVTEITKDKQGNIISTKQYKTGDSRSIASYMLIILGALLIVASAYIGTGVLNKRTD